MVQVNEFWDESIKNLTYHPLVMRNLNKLELKIGISLPQAYISLMLVHDGGYVKKDSFTYYDENRRRQLYGGIGIMLHITSGNDSIYNMLISPPEFFPKDLVPFADDGGGNLTCFDYRKVRENPPIVFWVCSDNEGEDVHFVANNFEEFVEMLHAPEG